MLTPSFVAAVDVLINGQALFTQTQRSALTHFAICPLLNLLLLHKFVSARVGRALFQVRFFQVPTRMPFPIRVHNFFYDVAIFTQLCFVSHEPKSIWRQTNHFNKTILSTPHCVAAPKSDRGRSNQLVLRDDWKPSQSESSCPLLKPRLLHTKAFRLGDVGFRHTSYCFTP